MNQTAPELSEGFPPQQQKPPGLTNDMRPVPDHGEKSYRGTGKLKGRRALITGGDSGIGRAVALAYAREGADVAFTYMPDEKDDASMTCALLESTKQTAVPIEADLRDREACDDVVRQAVEGLGGLDILVNNAGFQMAREEGIQEITDDRMDRVFRTNLYALFWITRAAVQHLGRGSVDHQQLVDPGL